MTEEELRQLFTTWRTRLGLNHWQLEIKIGQCESETSYMEIQRSVMYEAAVIVVAPWVLTGEQPENLIALEFTPKRVEVSLVHELLHCHTAGMTGVIDDELDGMLHRDVYATVRESFKHAEERAVEALAYTLVTNWS